MNIQATVKYVSGFFGTTTWILLYIEEKLICFVLSQYTYHGLSSEPFNIQTTFDH
jgi:hypothetical protein